MTRNFHLDSEPSQPSSSKKHRQSPLAAAAKASDNLKQSEQNNNDNDDNINDDDGHDSDTDTSLPDTSNVASSNQKHPSKIRAAAAAAALSLNTTGSKKRSRNDDDDDDVVVGDNKNSNKKSKNSKKKKTTKKRSEQLDPEQEFETVWICSECKEAECLMKPEANVLLICEGPCRRLFHYPCVGLSEVPPQDLPYVCPDCTAGRRRCAYCQDYGVDNVDIWACGRKSCGLFYHEACLAMQNVDVIQQEIPVVQQANSETENEDEDTTNAAAANDGEVNSIGATPTTTATTTTTTMLSFVCPAHSCWTCTQTSLKEQEKSTIAGSGSYKKSGKRSKAKGGKTLSSFECKTERFLYVSFVCVYSCACICVEWLESTFCLLVPSCLIF